MIVFDGFSGFSAPNPLEEIPVLLASFLVEEDIARPEEPPRRLNSPTVYHLAFSGPLDLNMTAWWAMPTV
jgi:hypothetical protein